MFNQLRLHTVSVNLFDISVKKHLCNAFNSFPGISLALKLYFCKLSPGNPLT